MTMTEQEWAAKAKTRVRAKVTVIEMGTDAEDITTGARERSGTLMSRSLSPKVAEGGL